MRLLIPALVSVAMVVGGQAPAQDENAGAYLAGRVASSNSDFEATVEYYGRALMADRTNKDLMEGTALAYVALGQFQSAVPIARLILEQQDMNQVGRLVTTVQELMTGVSNETIEELRQGTRVGALIDGLLTGWALMDQGKVGAAFEAFDTFAEDPQYTDFTLYQKGMALAQVGDFESAAALLGDFSPNGIGPTRRSVRALAQVYGQLGRFDDAVALLEASFDLTDPEIAPLYASLKAGQAVPFDIVPTPRDGMAEAFYLVATALEGTAADSFTLLYSRLAEVLAPHLTDATLLSARLLERLDQTDLAVKSYNAVAPEDPLYLRAQIGRVSALRDVDRIDEALAVLDTLATTYPDSHLVHSTRGDTLRGVERFAEASEAYTRAITLLGSPQPGDWFVYYARGITYERTDRWDEAEADFRKALELSPGQPGVLNYLGYSMVEMGINLPEALQMIRQAVEARPDNGYIVDSLGWVLYRLGRFQEAVVQMERAAELKPVDPIVTDHLGDVYWAVGRKREAEFQWRRALSFNPEPDEAERIRRKLDVGLDVVLEEEGAPSLAEKAANAPTDL